MLSLKRRAGKELAFSLQVTLAMFSPENPCACLPRLWIAGCRYDWIGLQT
jgi:hypothetical protein